jgi:hypothetical protein
MSSHLVRFGQVQLAALAGAFAITSCTNDVATGPSQASPQSPAAQQQSFRPTSSVSLAPGSYRWTDVNIPAGIVVTVTGSVSVVTTGDVMVAGKLAGDCVGVSITASGRLTIAGSVNNSCSGVAPTQGAPAMKLVGLGGYTIDHANLQTSGAFSITNDTMLLSRVSASATQSSGIGAALTSKTPLGGSPSRSSMPATAIPCDFVAGTLVANPSRAPDGAPGIHADSGRSGSRWIAACAGDMDVVGLFSVSSQAGGNGGIASATGAESKGGKAGNGGDLLLTATGEITFESGSTTILRSGDGGDGGSSETTAAGNGADAKAAGGAGGAPGLVKVNADEGIAVDGQLDISIGQAGDGGGAIATATDGVTCKQAGGNATAVGGAGGSTPDKSLHALGAVVGVENVDVTGGVAGRGGNAHTHGGNGAPGTKDCIDGGPGGTQIDSGGSGGSALLRDINKKLIEDGGKGGDALYEGGTGGAGFDKCTPTATDRGGNGGRGGDASGNSGVGGFGAAAGANGGIAVNMAGNGGAAGGGHGPGTPGDGGTNAIGRNSPPVIKDPSFKPGKTATDCAPPPPPPSTLKFGVLIQLDTAKSNDSTKIDVLLGVVFNRTLQITEQGTGATEQITVGPLSICDLPFALTNTGPTSFDAAGNFSADIVGPVNLGTHGIQPILVTINGQTASDGTIKFKIVVSPASTATFKFGRVTYNGTGKKQ